MRTMQDNLLMLLDAAKDNMTPKDLKSLAQSLGSNANLAAADMSGVVEGIYCLVGTEQAIHDAKDQNHGLMISGQFAEPGSVMSLLGCIAKQFDLIAGLIEVSSEARSLAEWKETEAKS